MSNEIFVKDSNYVLRQNKRLGNAAPGVLPTDVSTLQQTTTLTGTQTITGNKTFSGVEVFSGATGVTTDNITARSATFITANRALVSGHTTSAVPATVTLTAAQVVTGYITSTSAAATVMTLPTGTLLGAALGATQGTIHDLLIDNTAGANTVTIAVAVNGILSAAATANAGSLGLLTVPSGVTGQARFTLMFSSATAYTFTRTA